MGRQSPHMNDALFAELLESVREGGPFSALSVKPRAHLR